MSVKFLALFTLLAVASARMQNPTEMGNLMCACCSDNPPERCSEMRFAPPCDTPQFQVLDTWQHF